MAEIFNVQKQFVFYGAYHTNRINLLIHKFCVPLLLWTAQVLLAMLPVPAWFPAIKYDFTTPYLAFDMNWAFVVSAVYAIYYHILLPSAAVPLAPILTLFLLTADAFARNPDHLILAVALQGASWIAQFLGHGLAEKRAPALLDNLLGALVLAPFFVWLEILFSLGYFTTLHKQVQNGVGTELLRIRTEEAKKKRKAA